MNRPPAVMIVAAPSAAEAQALAAALTGMGWRALGPLEPGAALAAVAADAPAAALLVGVVEGRALCRDLRAAALPERLAILAACGSAEAARDMRRAPGGPDVIVTAPYAPNEIGAMLRHALALAGPSAPPGVLRHGDVVLDARTRRVMVGGTPAPVTPTGFALLATLMARPGEVVGREALLAACAPRSGDVQFRTVDAHVQGLRRALRRAGAEGVVRAVRGEGYVFCRETAAPSPRRAADRRGAAAGVRPAV